MSHGKPNSIKHTGAGCGDEIVGLVTRNRGMVLKLHSGQIKGPRRWPCGVVEVLDAGIGTYASFLLPYIGKTVDARELHDEILTAVNLSQRRVGRDSLSNLTVFDLNSMGLRSRVAAE